MTTRQPRYSAEEAAKRGEALYERLIRPQVEAAITANMPQSTLKLKIGK